MFPKRKIFISCKNFRKSSRFPENGVGGRNFFFVVVDVAVSACVVRLLRLPNGFPVFSISVGIDISGGIKVW